MTILRRRRDQSARHARGVLRWQFVVGWIVVGLLVTAPALHAQVRCNAGGVGGLTRHTGRFNGHDVTISTKMGPNGWTVLVSWRESGPHSIGEAFLDDGDGDLFHSFRWNTVLDHKQDTHFDHGTGGTEGTRHWNPAWKWVNGRWIVNPDGQHRRHVTGMTGTVFDKCRNMQLL